MTADRATPAFRDHFSEQAAAYAAYRPTYPPALFDWLASLTARHALAWDCATGNGQAARGVARHFDAVVATDASASQLAHAAPHPRVSYRQAPAHDSGLAAGSVDLVTVAQAFHWFDAPAFFEEVRRVLAPGGVVAVWCYGAAVVTAAPALDGALRAFYVGTVGPDWPPERALVDAGYRGVPFPFDEIAAPEFAIAHALDLAALLAYVGTWSAVARHRKRTGRDPVPDLARALGAGWGDPATRREIRWPIGLRVGRHGGATPAAPVPRR